MSVEYVRGSDQSIHIKAGGIIDTSGDFSIAHLVKADDNSHSIWYSEANTANDVVAINFDSFSGAGNTAPRVFVRDDASTEITITSGSAFTTAVWHHVALTRTGTTWTFYVDGVSDGGNVATLPGGGITRNTTDSGGWLRLNPLGYSDGQHENLRVYNRLLSPAEATTLAAGYRGALGGEVLWLDMEGVEAAAIATVLDKTTNKNHGAPQNAPVFRASIAPRYG